MNSRIRYVSKGVNLQSYKAIGGYVVEIHPSTKLVFLLNSTDHNIVAQSDPVRGGLHKMKIQAKKMLVEKGIAFVPETRDNKKDQLKKEEIEKG